ncbi:MAG TPA: hypothetical protein VJL58_03845 [Pyrinomonadaceae bacterium]|nr:hypothetical protein [Pyrinomonadaceae bacterium]
MSIAYPPDPVSIPYSDGNLQDIDALQMTFWRMRDAKNFTAGKGVAKRGFVRRINGNVGSINGN